MPRCPGCKTHTDLVKYEGVPIYNCGTCGGHWVSATKLNVILRRREIVMPEAVRDRMIEIAEASNRKETLICITCGREMIKEQFRYWPEIQIDRCEKCGGIWLDRAELEMCQIYWEYMQDHGDESGWTDTVERKALLDAAWVQRRADLESQLDAAEAYRSHHGYGPSYLLEMVVGLLFGRGR